MKKAKMLSDSRAPADLLVFGTDWYSNLHSSVKQVVGEMQERGSRVLWINPLPIRFPDVKRPDFWKKVQNKARTHARFLRKVDERTYVYSPIYLPLFNRLGWWINRVAVSAQVSLLRLILGMGSPLVVASEFTTWFAMPAIARLPVFFHFADKISAFREVAAHPERRRQLEEVERTLIRRSAVSGCSSRAIHEHVLEQAGELRERVLYLPHCVNQRVFLRDGLDGEPVPGDMAEIPHPIAGYFGSLTEANDKDAFLEVARAKPDWSFVFIGRRVGDYAALAELPNVHFLGPKPHAEIPLYGIRFDVAFMGWKPHEWIANCNPLKTLEYLALGKPVVSTGHIKELAADFGEVIRFCASAEELAAALDEELGGDGPDRMEARREFARGRSWDRYVDTVLDALEEGESGKRG